MFSFISYIKGEAGVFPSTELRPGSTISQSKSSTLMSLQENKLSQREKHANESLSRNLDFNHCPVMLAEQSAQRGARRAPKSLQLESSFLLSHLL